LPLKITLPSAAASTESPLLPPRAMPLLVSAKPCTTRPFTGHDHSSGPLDAASVDLVGSAARGAVATAAGAAAADAGRAVLLAVLLAESAARMSEAAASE
jgi:hypothetical protein